MLGKFETEARILAIRQQALCWRPLLLYQKSTSHTLSRTVTKKEKWIFYSSKRISRQQMATNASKL